MMIKVRLKSYNNKLLNKFYDNFCGLLTLERKIISRLIRLPSSSKSFSIIKSPHVYGRYSKEKYSMKVFKTSFVISSFCKEDIPFFLKRLEACNNEGIGIRLDIEI